MHLNGEKLEVKRDIPKEARILEENSEGISVLMPPIWQKLDMHFSQFSDLIDNSIPQREDL